MISLLETLSRRVFNYSEIPNNLFPSASVVFSNRLRKQLAITILSISLGFGTYIELTLRIIIIFQLLLFFRPKLKSKIRFLV